MIDAIGPFFRGSDAIKINWSKIPFDQLALEGEGRSRQFAGIRADMMEFARRVGALGYNAVSIDDVSHLVDHEWYEAPVREQIHAIRTEFKAIFELLRANGLEIHVTIDVFSSTPGLRAQLQANKTGNEEFLRELLNRFLLQWPEVSGVIMRIGESDGLDVRSDFKSELVVKTPCQLNRLLKTVLPVFERHARRLILRTWTVGAYPIGDLIWHRDTLARSLRGISSPSLVLSMKHGESDFFRFLPLSKHFFHLEVPMIIELQTKREYEGCGEFPSFIGYDHEQYARELRRVPNMLGISVWCQTGGWVPFRRLAFVGEGSPWTEINTQVTLDVFRHGKSVEQSVELIAGAGDAPALLELLRLSSEVVCQLYYHDAFASQKLFFRRVRIPPLMGVYWNTIFVNPSIRRVLRFYAPDNETAILSALSGLEKLDRMMQLARQLSLPTDDIRFMKHTLGILALAREYYHHPCDDRLGEQLRLAKQRYKRVYPRGSRYRYSIKIDLDSFRSDRRFWHWSLALLIRRKRGYRVIDQIFTIHLLALLYRLVRKRRARWIPEFARDSAMGVDTIFR